MIITSPANERIKQARRVRDGREQDLIFVEGERLVEECLQSRLKLIACFHSPQSSPRAQTIISEIASRYIPIFPTTDAVLGTISDTVNSQGLIVLAERPNFTLNQIITRGDASPLIVCLDAVQDPGNLGTIIRTAEAAGANGVVALKGSAGAYAPKTLRGSMGSAFRLPVMSDIDFDEILPTTRTAGIKVVATASKAEKIYNDYDWRQPTLVIFGNEARGAGAELWERCDERLRIPLHAPVESINVAAAAAVVLFEAARQRRAEQN
jgi:TrmH family RNA methyltransferase